MVNVIRQVTTEFEIPDSDIEVLVEMAGYGIGYWATSANSGVEGEYSLTWDDWEAEAYHSVTQTVTYEELAKALVEVSKSSYYVGEYAIEYFKSFEEDGEGDAGHFDSELGDAVVQYALFGEMIYG